MFFKKDKTINSLNEQVQKDTENIEQLRKDIENKNSIISKLNKKITENNKYMNYLQNRIVELSSIISKKEDEILKRELLRRKAAGRCGGLISAINKKNSEIALLNKTIESLKIENKVKNNSKTLPPTIEELRRYQMFGNRKDKKIIK